MGDRVSLWASFLLSAPLLAAVTAEAQSLASLQAFSSPGGALLGTSSWTNDPTPYFVWTPQAGAAIAGYSFALDAEPDCVVDTTEQSLQLGALADGVHGLQVRAIGSPAGCGPATIAGFQIDATSDGIPWVSAWTRSGGTQILPGIYQPDRDPRMTWITTAVLSPIFGFSYAIDGPADCFADTFSSFVDLPVLGPGLHEFQVRETDAAGNCSAPASFTLAIGDPPAIPVFPALEPVSRPSRPSAR